MSASTPPSTPNETGSPAAWGYERPDCRGETALLYFTTDLGRTIQAHLADRAVTKEDVQAAQLAIDALIQRYVAIEAAPYAFQDQQITLRIEVDRTADGVEVPYVALQTSPRLEDLIIEAQNANPGGTA